MIEMWMEGGKMKYNKEQREKLKEEAKGKIIKNLDYDEEGNYWVMEFIDSSEICFRFMAELI